MRRAVLLAVSVLVLAGCATAADGGSPRQVELEGTIRAAASSGADRTWVIDTGEGMLALDLPSAPPLGARGVIAEVPDGVELPDDLAGIVGALSDYGARTGEPLTVLDFLR
ncbi:hypothetical protein BH11ACT5_BH11ACT5_23550 [soil metagenome]